MADSFQNPRQAVLTARFVWRNRLESYTVDQQVLRKLDSITNSKDFLHSDMFLASTKQSLKDCLKRCRESATEDIARNLATETLLQLVALRCKIWHTQGIRQALVGPVGGTTQKQTTHAFDVAPYLHLAFVILASGHVHFAPDLIQLSENDIEALLKPRYKTPPDKSTEPCVQDVPKMLQDMQADIFSAHRRLSIAEKVYGSNSAVQVGEMHPGRRFLMHLLADWYVGLDNKLDQVYIERKMARQREIAQEFDSLATREYLLKDCLKE